LAQAVFDSRCFWSKAARGTVSAAMVMVPCLESELEGTLLWKLGVVAAALKQKVQLQTQSVHLSRADAGAELQEPTDAHRSPRSPDRSFELADHLESGTGPGLASQYAEPRPAEQCFLVTVSEDAKEHILTTEDGKRLLIARLDAATTGAGTTIGIFTAYGGQDARSPVPDFRLQSDASKSSWSLCVARCERCESRGRRQQSTRELARIRHHNEHIGEGEAFCMDVKLPEYAEAPEGSPGGCCQVCGACPVGEVSEVTSRRPYWDARNETLRLGFQGRCNAASERNFQLEVPGSDRRAPAKLLFGEREHAMNEVGKKLFALYHSEPLGTVQAFAAALSTVHWA